MISQEVHCGILEEKAVKVKVVSTLDGRLVDSTVSDEDRGSRIAIMGAVMYGSIQSMLSTEETKIKATLPKGLMRVEKKGDRLIIEIYDGKAGIRSHLEKP